MLDSPLNSNDTLAPEGWHDTMLSIGLFAERCGTTVKTIRYYDEIGLLKADYVSLESGYRYYRRSSIDTFLRITALKEAGFSLTEIQKQLCCLDDSLVMVMLTEKAALFEKQQRLCLSLRDDYLRKVEAQQMKATQQYSMDINSEEHQITITASDGSDVICFRAPSEHLQECAELVMYSLQDHFIYNEFDDLKRTLDGKEVFLWFPFYSKMATAEAIKNICYPEMLTTASQVFPIVRFPMDDDAEVVEILNVLERQFGGNDGFPFDADLDPDEEGIRITFLGIR